jgi:DNA-binding transcriptional ArsR family regulator
MTLAWKSDIASGPKMVLLSLCDNANDQGECYPSIATISQRCSMSERTVQRHIADLQKLKIVRGVERSGRSTIYHIDARKICTPADLSPPQICHPTPADLSPPPPQICHPTPANLTPITVNEPSIEPSLNRNKTLARPDDVSESVWSDFLLIRKTKKSALTETALAGIRAEANKAGLTMDEALAMCCTRGWQSFRADWVKPEDKASAKHGAKPKVYHDISKMDYTKGVDDDGRF